MTGPYYLYVRLNQATLSQRDGARRVSQKLDLIPKAFDALSPEQVPLPSIVTCAPRLVPALLASIGAARLRVRVALPPDNNLSKYDGALLQTQSELNSFANALAASPTDATLVPIELWTIPEDRQSVINQMIDDFEAGGRTGDLLTTALEAGTCHIAVLRSSITLTSAWGDTQLYAHWLRHAVSTSPLTAVIEDDDAANESPA